MSMLESQTAVVERNTVFDADFATEPFEVAWAREARWFVNVLEHEGAPLSYTTQISPDGLNWIDYDDTAATSEGTGIVSWPVREFGHWMRIRANFGPDGGRVKVRIYLALKS